MGLLDALVALGLTEYAAKAYAALVALGEADAESVADESGVPRTRVYAALQELVEGGWARDSGGRPRRWRAEPPRDCFARAKARLEEAVAGALPALESRFEKRAMRVGGEIWILEGRDAIVGKAEEMLQGARRSVLVALGWSDPFDEALLRALRAVARRGVLVQAMAADATASDRLLAVPAEVRLVPLPVRAMIVDRRQVLLWPPAADRGHRAIWNPSPELVEIMADMIGRVWSVGAPYPLALPRSPRE